MINCNCSSIKILFLGNKVDKDMKKNKRLFAISAIALIVISATVFALWNVFTPKSFPEATGTISMLSLSNPKGIKGMDKYIDLRKMNDATWIEDTAGEEVLIPYGIVYNVANGEMQTMKGNRTASDLGFAYSTHHQSYYGVFDNKGKTNSIGTFRLTEGQNEFSQELKQNEILYSSKNGVVYNPLLLSDNLYFVESLDKEKLTLCQYDIKSKKKAVLVDQTGILFGIGKTGICYDNATNDIDYVYIMNNEGQKKLLAENAIICGRSSNGQQVLIRQYEENGQISTASVYDCSKGEFLSEIHIEKSWGELMTGTISPDTRFVAACFKTGPEHYQIRMIDTETNKQIPLFADLSDNFWGCCIDWF